MHKNQSSTNGLPPAAPQALDVYVKQRCATLALSGTELCRRAGISRQTLRDLSLVPQKMPTLATLSALAEVLHVHPLDLLQRIFDQPEALRKGSRQRRADRSAFIRDVTMPDGSLVLPGQQFVKTWEMQNVGTVAWEGRSLVCMDDEIVVTSRRGAEVLIAAALRPEQTRIEVPPTPPGKTVQLSMVFTAPQAAGTALSYWKSYSADNELCFPSSQGLWVKVRVVSLAAAERASVGA